jgi:hypothetical protein
MSYKLLVEKTDPTEFEYIVCEEGMDKAKRMYVTGPYMMANDVNKNDRVYPLDELVKEVTRYEKEFVRNNRAMGELNHPTSAEVDLERACHVVTELRQDRNVILGKSKILQTPMGKIVENLILDDVKIGMSSRSLGKLTPMNSEGSGKTINKVSEMKLIAIDCVADPSYPDAFVNGILESKQWILNKFGQYEEIFDRFETGLDHLPNKGTDLYLKEHILKFISQI